jgi:hypothetical protein
MFNTSFLEAIVTIACGVLLRDVVRALLELIASRWPKD